MNNNNSSNNRHYNYPYLYNNQAFNTNASRFNMNQMPMPNQAYQAENSALPALMYEIPAAISFVNLEQILVTNHRKAPNPYSNYYFVKVT
ncbi:hypothetical protein HUE58_02265 [Candidatus Ruthia endofausta]|uniref:Uncharacterized protein n=1 Tax=Candidatus Ruthia endofausta TaxID=2738852 RepID=A0A6N0HNQ1_9GAMM|nr:hypothetical protein [Candidatus Ruthia endofausta]QKQ24009.1 hypothetical protein HUE58_02265 [Candidatus Ruthia endofausta]